MFSKLIMKRCYNTIFSTIRANYSEITSRYNWPKSVYFPDLRPFQVIYKDGEAETDDENSDSKENRNEKSRINRPTRGGKQCHGYVGSPSATAGSKCCYTVGNGSQVLWTLCLPTYHEKATEHKKPPKTACSLYEDALMWDKENSLENKYPRYSKMFKTRDNRKN